MYRSIPNYELVTRSSNEKGIVHAPEVLCDFSKIGEAQALTPSETTKILKESKKANYKQFKNMGKQIK